MGMRLKELTQQVGRGGGGVELSLSKKSIRPGDRFFQVWLDLAYVHMIGRFHRDATSRIRESSTLLRRANE